MPSTRISETISAVATPRSLDNVTSAVNRRTAAAGRGADKIKLNARIGELNKQRQGLAAQLGTSLYEAAANEKDGE